MGADERAAGWPAIGIVASTFAVAMAATTVITPLYPGYVAEFGLSSLEVTIVFAAYGAAVMLGLALFGRLSDHYGRKPPLGAALCVAIASMVVFLLAQGIGALLLGRVLIGLTAGVYTGTCTAWLVDLCPDRVRAAKIAIAANLGGLGLGPLLGGVLAQWAPRPLRLVYAVELVLLVLGLIAHRWMPETVRARAVRPRPPRPPPAAAVRAGVRPRRGRGDRRVRRLRRARRRRAGDAALGVRRERSAGRRAAARGRRSPVR